MTSVILINYRSQAEFDRRDLAVDLSETMIKANIPVEKLDHPVFMDFIKRRVPGDQCGRRPMWQEILDKSETYFEWSGTPPTYCQKGLNFFKRTRLLGPRQAKKSTAYDN